LGKILFPDPGVGWLPELPEDEELGRSFGSLALKLLWKAVLGWFETSDPESKLPDPRSLLHLLPRTKCYNQITS